MSQDLNLLITVITYPLPSKTYNELVCTAGITETGEFIRLYPIDYRYRPYWQWFKKYQWVNLSVEKHNQDPRPESFRPLGNIEPLGPPLDTKNNWEKRKKFVLKREIHSMCYLNKLDQSEVSLGIIRPASIGNFTWEKVARDWKPKCQAAMNQQELFGPNKKPLDKIPYRFSYHFKCTEQSCKGHKMMIEDWETGQLYRRMRDKFNNEEIACQKVKEKFYDTICGKDRDTYFYVGTTLRFGTWIVIGTFWPKLDE